MCIEGGSQREINVKIALDSSAVSLSLPLSRSLPLLHCPLMDNGLKCVCIAKCSVRCHTHTPTLTSGKQRGEGGREAIVVLQFKVHFNAIWLPFVPVIFGAVHTGKQTVALPVSLALPPSLSLSLTLGCDA